MFRNFFLAQHLQLGKGWIKITEVQISRHGGIPLIVFPYIHREVVELNDVIFFKLVDFGDGVAPKGYIDLELRVSNDDFPTIISKTSVFQAEYYGLI